MSGTGVRPQTISRQLRAFGFTISGSEHRYRRAGVFVGGGGKPGTVSVLVDLELATKNARAAQQITEHLRSKGYQVEVRMAEGADEARFITVSRPNRTA